MKTKVRFNIDTRTNTKGIVGYIDGYVANNNLIYACVVVEKVITFSLLENLEVINEDTFIRELTLPSYKKRI